MPGENAQREKQLRAPEAGGPVLRGAGEVPALDLSGKTDGPDGGLVSHVLRHRAAGLLQAPQATGPVACSGNGPDTGLGNGDGVDRGGVSAQLAGGAGGPGEVGGGEGEGGQQQRPVCVSGQEERTREAESSCVGQGRVRGEGQVQDGGGGGQSGQLGSGAAESLEARVGSGNSLRGRTAGAGFGVRLLLRLLRVVTFLDSNLATD